MRAHLSPMVPAAVIYSADMVLTRERTGACNVIELPRQLGFTPTVNYTEPIHRIWRPENSLYPFRLESMFQGVRTSFLHFV